MKCDNDIQEKIENIFTEIINDFDGGWNTREHHVTTLIALIKAEYERGRENGYKKAIEDYNL